MLTLTARRAPHGVLAALAVLVLAACGADLGPDPSQPAGDSNIRFLHAARDAGPVDLRWIDQTAFSDVAFGAASANGQYTRLRTGFRHLWVVRASDDSVLTHGEISVRPDRDYSLALVRVGSAYNLSVLLDTNTAPAAGRAKLRVWHLGRSITAPTLAVYATAPGADLATAVPVDDELEYREGSPYAVLDAGTYQVRFVSGSTGAVVHDAGTIVLAAGQIRTVALLDAEGAGVRSLVLADRDP